MLVTDRHRVRRGDLVKAVTAAARGGVAFVQVREPDLPDDELRELVQRIREGVGKTASIVVNGSERVARTTGSGLHLPARAGIAGPGWRKARPFGRSVHDDDEMGRALRDWPDYLVLGTIYETPSKPGVRPAGVALVERICRQVHPLPVYAIGGITVTRVPAMIHAGAHGVAVCGEILSSNDPERVAQAMTLALEVAARVSETA
jgi:thiamine-phosphate diphosphorylase